jgi:hypothetical protein
MQRGRKHSYELFLPLALIFLIPELRAHIFFNYLNLPSLHQCFNKAQTIEFKDSKKIAIFCYVILCGSCKDRHFGGTHRLHHQGDKNR